MTTGTCRGCGEQIGLVSVCTRPMERRWLHMDWQNKYDHLPAPTVELAWPDVTTPTAKGASDD